MMPAGPAPHALVGGRVLLRDRVVEDRAVILAGTRILDVLDARALDPAMPRHDLGGLLLAPGFIDVQVNGGGGVLFNDEPTPEGIAAIGRAHRRFGTTGFLPTLITDRAEVMVRAMRAVDDAIEARMPGVLGIHLEGPHLGAGRPGVHDASLFRALDDDALALLTAPRRGITLVTLAPEAAPDPLVRRLVQAGVRVCIGHTDATYAQTRATLAAGATGFTHLFNAMSPLASRAPGAVGAALESRAWCGIIADGHHVDPAVLRLALRAAGQDRFVLVSDAMPCVGAAHKDFSLQGRAISVRDGVCRDASGRLAGSHLDMASAVQNAQTMLGVDLPVALAMASRAPAAMLGLASRGAIAAGCVADLVLLDGPRVAASWIGGVFAAA